MQRSAARRPSGAGALARFGWAVLAGLALAAPAHAQRGPAAAPNPVVLELYTAQGCAACPPADEMLAALAAREDVIALALHVDYWDYIGWADVFADPEHAERQKRYARRHGHSTIYTPQVVINGTDVLEGFRVVQVMEQIERHRAQPPRVALTLARDEAGLMQIRAEVIAGADEDPGPLLASRAVTRGLAMAAEAEGPAPHDVQLVRYLPRQQVEITGGENAGLTADYVNIVTSWQTIGTWDLRAPLDLSVPAEGEGPAVVILQEPRQGPIVAAARLR